MRNNNSVVFKGRKEGITVLIDKDSPFDEIKETLKSKITDAQQFFGNAKTSIMFKGRELSESEQMELLDIIKSSSELDISFVTDEAHPKTRAKSAKAESGPAYDNTYYHRGSLRSGQSVTFDGGVVIIGDVNPGAEIFATGSVVVMGALRGLVHAGCKGDYGKFVSALNFRPVQLRIADIYTAVPQDEFKDKRAFSAIAFVEDRRIFIEQIGGE